MTGRWQNYLHKKRENEYKILFGTEKISTDRKFILDLAIAIQNE